MKATVIVVSCVLLIQSYCNGASDIVDRLRSRQPKDNNNKDENEKDEIDDDPDVSVFIGYKRSASPDSDGSVGEDAILDRPIIDGFDMSQIRLRSRYKLSDSINAIVKKSQIESMIKNNPNIEYIEVDPTVYPDGETLLYGMDMIQARVGTTSTTVPVKNYTSSCNDPNSFKIGIVDSGLAINHPDIPCTNTRRTTTNCIGKEFGLDDPSNKWNNPIERYHGTHVAGTIGATFFNNDGVQGVLNDGKYCFIIGRVFGEGAAGAKMSSILSAIEWMVSQGANVINLSLSTSDYTQTGQTIVQNAHNAGTILVAAAGNEGISDYRYPASYTNVISVAAVDSEYKQAEFSQYNDAVDIAAPGVDILSTFPLTIGGVLFFDTPKLSAVGQYLKYSVQRSSAIVGKLVNCAFGTRKCPGSGGHICILQRGQTNFETKGLNCAASGGIAAVIYNNVTTNNEWALPATTKVKIPVFQLSLAHGSALKQKSLNANMTISTKKGYSFLSGTSMATPHVVGVISRLWRTCRSCTNKQITTCILQTAVDLGAEGVDWQYGSGLIQLEDALSCLISSANCCLTRTSN